MSNLHKKRTKHNNENASANDPAMSVIFWLIILPGLLAVAVSPWDEDSNHQGSRNISRHNASNTTNASLQSVLTQTNVGNATVLDAAIYNQEKFRNATPDYPRPFVSNTSKQFHRQPG